jgi:MFS family permease
VVTFCDQLLQAVQTNLTPYVTSEFSQHGLLATTSIVASVLGGVSNLAIAKIIDIWGRCEGFLAMLLLVVVGMIMKATCQNVETYAAAHTIYWVGHLGLLYVITIILADTTTLKNRAIILGLNYTPTIATTFAGPRIADLFYTNVNFRWAFGAFCIMLIVFCAPVAVIFILSKRKAIRMGVYPVKTESRTVWGSCKYYFVQFDGMLFFLICATANININT